MGEVLSRLYSATSRHLTPSGPSSGGLEFAVGLQGGLEGWCQLLMRTEVDSVQYVCASWCVHGGKVTFTGSPSFSHRWLQELIVCVSVCSSELQASEALARLLCAGGGKEQVGMHLACLLCAGGGKEQVMHLACLGWEGTGRMHVCPSLRLRIFTLSYQQWDPITCTYAASTCICTLAFTVMYSIPPSVWYVETC